MITIFKAMDKDKNGELSSEEIEGAVAALKTCDKNEDGKIQYTAGAPFEGKPAFDGENRGNNDERLLTNTPTDNTNELYVDRDIMVLANPEIAQLPNWVIALVAAGGLAAAITLAFGAALAIGG